MTDNNPFLVVAIVDSNAQSLAGASMIKVIMKELKQIV